MTTDWLTIFTTVGFPVGLILIALRFFAKSAPVLLEEWRRFVAANEKFAQTVERNTEITYKSYDESISVKDLLQQAIEKLDHHHDNATEIKDDVWEVRSILTELMQELEEMREK